MVVDIDGKIVDEQECSAVDDAHLAQSDNTIEISDVAGNVLVSANSDED